MMDELELTGKEKNSVGRQAGLKLIPGVGGALSGLYYGRKQEIRFKRIEKFYQELSMQLKDIESKLLPIEKHDQETLLALIEEINEKIEHEHREEKQKYFSKSKKHSMPAIILSCFNVHPPITKC